MEMRIITETQLCKYEAWLREAEKSDATMEKYLRDVRAFFGIYAEWSGGKDGCDGVQTAAD